MKKLCFFLLSIMIAFGLSSCSEDTQAEEPVVEDEEPEKAIEEEPVEQDWDICHLGDKKPCYTGPKNTEGVGICKAGFYNCIADENGDLMWDESRCLNEVHPDYTYPCTPQDPSRDFDCNGIPDNEQDEDGDGYTICSDSGYQNDCCDNTHMCINPAET